MARFTHHPLIVSIILLLLFSICQSKLWKHQNKVSSSQHKFFPFAVPTTMVFFSDVKQQKLEKYDPKNLNQTSKQVDEFIRKQANLSNIELTAAKGNGQRFVYTYENKSEYKNQTYIFTVEAVKEQKNDAQRKSQTAKHEQAQSSYVYVEPVNVVRQSPMVYVEPVPAHKQSQATASSTTTTAPTTSSSESTNDENPKYRIVGINYVVSSKPTEEQKKKMAEQKKEYEQKIKKFNEKWGKLKEEQDKQLSEISDIFGDDDFWWHK